MFHFCRLSVRSSLSVLLLALISSWLKNDHIGYCYADDSAATVLTASVGESVILDCVIDFPNEYIVPHVLEWRKDGEVLFSWADGETKYGENYLNRVSLLPEKLAWERGQGSINLTSIRESDQGWYECKVYFPNRTPPSKLNGTWFRLDVEGGNLLAIPPTNETVMEGEPVKLRCVSKSSDATVTWYKNHEPVNSIDEMKDRVRLSPEGSLNIVPTDMKDTGYYHCEVSNSEDEKQSAGAYLNIQYKAKVVYSPKQVFLPYGRPGTLECYFKANPEITKIRWEKDGFLFDAYNVPGVFARRNGTLYFSKVDESHTGEYTCTPYNELGTQGPSNRMHVVVQRPPIFTITPHVLYIRKTGESVVMACDAIDGESAIRPTISWFKRDGTVIPQERSSIDGGNLTIGDIQEDDRGVYQCIASNEAATISSEAELIIENTSRNAPYNVSANVTQTSIIVRWSPGYYRPKLEYSIWYREIDTPEWRTIKVNSKESTEGVISNLSPSKEYEVMILAQDQHGDGMFSKAVQIRTEGLDEKKADDMNEEFRSPVGMYQQIGPPYDLFVQVTPIGFKVNWKPPKHGEEMLKYYTLVWYDQSNEEMVGNARTVDSSYTVKNLDEERTYTMQVFAMSTNDYEASSMKYIYHVPSFHKTGAIFVGAASGVLLVTMFVAVAWYVKKKNGKSLFN